MTSGRICGHPQTILPIKVTCLYQSTQTRQGVGIYHREATGHYFLGEPAQPRGWLSLRSPCPKYAECTVLLTDTVPRLAGGVASHERLNPHTAQESIQRPCATAIRANDWQHRGSALPVVAPQPLNVHSEREYALVSPLMGDRMPEEAWPQPPAIIAAATRTNDAALPGYDSPPCNQVSSTLHVTQAKQQS